MEDKIRLPEKMGKRGESSQPHCTLRLLQAAMDVTSKEVMRGLESAIVECSSIEVDLSSISGVQARKRVCAGVCRVSGQLHTET